MFQYNHRDGMVMEPINSAAIKRNFYDEIYRNQKRTLPTILVVILLVTLLATIIKHASTNGSKYIN